MYIMGGGSSVIDASQQDSSITEHVVFFHTSSFCCSHGFSYSSSSLEWSSSFNPHLFNISFSRLCDENLVTNDSIQGCIGNESCTEEHISAKAEASVNTYSNVSNA